MELGQLVQNVDYAILNIIYFELKNDVFDVYLPIFRNKWFWVPLYVYLISYIIFNLGKKAIVVLGIILITFSLTDSISSSLIKKNVKRPRPCHEQVFDYKPLVVCGQGYSFTSSHAANHFGLSMSLILLLPFLGRIWKFLLLFWACVISFAQIYVGLHYFTDVLGGALLGIGVAWLLSNIYYFCSKSSNYSNIATERKI